MSELEIPESWASSCIGDLTENVAQGAPSKTFDYIDIESIDNNLGVVASPKVLAPKDAPSRARKILVEGDVVFSTVRPYLKNIAVVPHLPNPIGSTGFCVLRCQKLNNKFLYHYVRSAPFLSRMESCQKGANYPAVKDSDVRESAMPLPPLAEQHRIVSKIESTHSKIAAIEKAVTEAEALLKKYRESLLAKAFRGELVPQDPNEEPASKLLDRIRAERAKAIKNGEIKKAKKDELPPISDDEIPFEIPKSWEWVRLGEIATISSEVVNPKDFPNEPHIAPNHIESGTGNLLPYTTVSKDAVTSPKFRFFRGTLLYSKIRPNLNKATIVSFDGLCSADMYPLTSKVNPQYLLRYILSEFFLSFAVRSNERVLLPKINREELFAIPVPLPPAAEQLQIFESLSKSLGNVSASVDQMALIKLELSKQKQALLGSAFSGRLVPQDPSEGTGHELLAQILKEKQSEEPIKEVKKPRTTKAPRK